MHRRQFVQGIALAGLARPLCAEAMSAPEAATVATRYVDHEHPTIRAAVADAAPAILPAIERAVRLHDFVRDRVLFGWSADFYDQPASQVLAEGIGFCNTKGTLFVALLRAAGIPARQHFVNINAALLDPFIDPGMPYVDHSFVEVLLDGRWIATDSYIVDAPLHRAAKRELRARGRTLGFGIHRDGSADWDGRNASFSQYVTSAPGVSLSTLDHGVHADVGAFYASGAGVNRLNVFLRLGFGWFARAANQRIAALRATG